ncbi:MFS transporter [Pseudonocardia sp. HH130630-07]|uniref:MFS transporter n=1 Tax=Pseudonocardia sp. HH130630-07 TaxID=1690815 RepID=UPI000839D081|nr:MFS transporter [Pseudonocardia sp. HH130630-07]
MLGATLMISQSFLYNAVFFSYSMMLVRFFDVAPSATAVYLVPFAVGNLLGLLVLGHLFDRIGRRKMIARCYGLAGGLLALSAVLFGLGGLTAVTQTLAWCVVFFFASAGASAGYVTVSEIFPMEVRAKAIAIAFALAQTAGSAAPLLYGALIDTAEPNRASLTIGLLVGAAFMGAGAVVARHLGVDAERRPLESIAPPFAVRAATGDGIDHDSPDSPNRGVRQ